jgi:hypothetical protein
VHWRDFIAKIPIRLALAVPGAQASKDKEEVDHAFTS